VRGGSQLSRVALGALLVFVAVLSLGPMAESDLFFRIKAGQEILARHGLPGRNLFSFTYPDYPDIDTSWLFEVGAAALYGRGGFPAIVLAKTGVLMAAFAGAFALCRRRGAGPVASALALAAAAYAARDRFVERPHIFSLAGAVVVLAAIDVVAAATGTRGARAPGRGRAVGEPACGRLRRGGAARAGGAGRRARSPGRG
jgi:hypothetical protein